MSYVRFVNEAQWTQGRRETPAITLPAGVTVGQCLFRKKQVIYTLFNDIFCNIAIVLFLYYIFFFILYFEEALPSLASSEETPLAHMHKYICTHAKVGRLVRADRKLGNESWRVARWQER